MNSQPRYRRLMVRSLSFAAPLFGRVSMLAFVVFIYAGPVEMLQIKRPFDSWLVWDVLLSFLFFVQHSAMIRRGFRVRMAKWLPMYCHGAVFTLASAVALMTVVLFWQSSGILLVEIHGPAAWLIRAVFFASAAGIGWGIWSLKSFDLFGIAPIKAKLAGKPQKRHSSFIARGAYLWVRHPLYFFIILMLWSRPDLTLDRLLFNLFWSAWIYFGTVLEEKDLAFEFGDQYREYQKKVPMLFPWKGCRREN